MHTCSTQESKSNRIGDCRSRESYMDVRFASLYLTFCSGVFVKSINTNHQERWTSLVIANHQINIRDLPSPFPWECLLSQRRLSKNRLNHHLQHHLHHIRRWFVKHYPHHMIINPRGVHPKKLNLSLLNPPCLWSRQRFFPSFPMITNPMMMIPLKM